MQVRARIHLDFRVKIGGKKCAVYLSLTATTAAGEKWRWGIQQRFLMADAVGESMQCSSLIQSWRF